MGKKSKFKPDHYDPNALDPMFGIPQEEMFSSSMLDEQKGIDLNSIIKVRNRILEKMYSYCAELSQELLYEFDFQVVDKVRSLLIDIEIADKFVAIDDLIREEGIAQAGAEVLVELKKLIDHEN